MTYRRKPCSPQQIRNPKTGRCVKKSGSIGRRIRRQRSTSRRRSYRRKPCSPQQIRNPKTGRCVKKSGSIGRRIRRQRSVSRRRSYRRKPCSPQQIQNPKTGRCVKPSSTVGQKIQKRYRSPLVKRKQTSPSPPRVVSPVVNRPSVRFVNTPEIVIPPVYDESSDESYRPDINEIDGDADSESISMGHLQLSNTVVHTKRKRGRPIPDEPLDKPLFLQKRRIPQSTAIEIQKIMISNGYTIGKLMGKGSYSNIYHLIPMDSSKDPAIMRITKKSSNLTRTIKAYNLLYNKGLAPKIPYINNVHLYEISIMERVSSIVGDLLEDYSRRLKLYPQYPESILNQVNKIGHQAVDLLKLLKDMNITHTDLHWGNIAYVERIENEQIRSKMVLIDFDSTVEKYFPALDATQLTRTTGCSGFSNYFKFDKRIVQILCSYLEPYLESLYETYSNTIGPKSRIRTERGFNAMFQNYMSQIDRLR